MIICDKINGINKVETQKGGLIYLSTWLAFKKEKKGGRYTFKGSGRG